METLGKEELNRLEQVFASNWIGKGKLVTEFEQTYAAHLGSTPSRVLSTNCCSEGLFSSMHLCDIQPGDEVAVDFDTGLISDITTGKTYQAQPFPAFIQNIIAKGGLLASLKEN